MQSWKPWVRALMVLTRMAGTGAPQRQAQLLADRGIDAEGGHAVARAADGEAGNELGSKGRPRPSPGCLLLPEEVLLRVVKVRRHIAAVALLGHRLGRPPV